MDKKLMASVVDLLLVVYKNIEIMLKLVISNGAGSIGVMRGKSGRMRVALVGKDLDVESSTGVG